jgi:hypothetical protein
MFCPKCRTEYRNGFTTCADCELTLVPELPPEPSSPSPTPAYVKYVNLYSPRNEVESALLKSILDSEGIGYFVRNDNFGSLEVGPHIGLFNAKMVQVQDDQYDRARELLSDYLEKTEKKSEEPDRKYSLFDKIRMVIEVLVFSWLMPGRAKHRSRE